MKVDVLKRIWERSLDLNQMVLLQLIGTNVDIRELLNILKVTGMITLLLKQEQITKTEENDKYES